MVECPAGKLAGFFYALYDAGLDLADTGCGTGFGLGNYSRQLPSSKPENQCVAGEVRHSRWDDAATWIFSLRWIAKRRLNERQPGEQDRIAADFWGCKIKLALPFCPN